MPHPLSFPSGRNSIGRQYCLAWGRGMLHSGSLRAVGQWARLAFTAGGLIFASVTMAAAIEIPANVNRLLNDPKICWKAQFFEPEKKRWTGEEDTNNNPTGEY